MSEEEIKMDSPLPFRVHLLCFLCISIRTCLADSSPVQDTCPTATPGQQTLFINGFPCKNPATVTASDFKTSKLNNTGDTDNFLRSSMSIITAADFPGLNTLGISFARTDLAAEGMVLPHAHPRASELFFVNKGVVVAGFIDTGNQLFLNTLQEGDVLVFPRGLLHFCWNGGFDLAIIFSVLNSQYPGVVSIADAMFRPASDEMERLLSRFLSLSTMGVDGTRNMTGV